ncbi:hypothetical protein BH11PSE3_BH11PSE3_27730 [soil metagenome]
MTVPGKAWQILVMLVEARGRLVPHETLRESLWPSVMVEDRTLTVHVSTLRKILGCGSLGDFIETVPREGYRLALTVRVLAETDSTPRIVGTSPMPAVPTLAVQTFSTPGVADAHTYLGVGIADAVSTALGGMSGLRVSPPNAVDDLTVARSLGVGHFLEGTVQRSDDGLRVSARLIDVASGLARWSERFEQPQREGAVVQDAIAQRVASSLPGASTVEHPPQSYRPRATEAYFLQLEARAHLKPFTRLPLMKALSLFEQAITLDPDYAMAHAGLASTYLLMASTAMLRPLQVDEAMPMARRSAQRAIALDEGLAEGWAALGRVKLEYDWDWEGAEANLAHAVALNAS